MSDDEFPFISSLDASLLPLPLQLLPASPTDTYFLLTLGGSAVLGAGDIEQKAQALALRSKRDKGAAVVSVVREMLRGAMRAWDGVW